MNRGVIVTCKLSKPYRELIPWANIRGVTLTTPEK